VPRWQSAFSSEDGHEISSPDRLFDALSARLRRQALFYLLEEPETTIDDLADVLAGWRSTATGPVGPTERERIAVELRHVHLPRLDEATLVEFDSVAGDVRLRELPDPVRELVRFAHRYDNTAEETV
jgi:hypothetical protein